MAAKKKAPAKPAAAKPKKPKSTSTIAPGRLTQRQVAKRVGIGDRALRDCLAAEWAVGVPKGTAGIDFEAFVLAYCAHLREVAAGRKGEGDDGSLSLARERARLAKEQADGQALKNALERGRSADTEDVLEVWSAHIKAARDQVLGVRERARTRIPRLRKRDLDALAELLAAAVREVSDFDGLPDSVRERSLARGVDLAPGED